jgi:hypothetical protein
MVYVRKMLEHSGHMPPASFQVVAAKDISASYMHVLSYTPKMVRPRTCVSNAHSRQKVHSETLPVIK